MALSPTQVSLKAIWLYVSFDKNNKFEKIKFYFIYNVYIFYRFKLNHSQYFKYIHIYSIYVNCYVLFCDNYYGNMFIYKLNILMSFFKPKKIAILSKN